MSTFDYESINKTITTGAIVALVVSTVFGFILCIGTIIIIVCLIKRCNQSSRSRVHEAVLHQPFHYSNYSLPQNSFNTTSTTDHPPVYLSAPPPYQIALLSNNVPNSGFMKPPYR
ncbi:unnamed protein product [Rotaria socialis]|uniref:Uncharacterized protein n=1 Tax=Rotaria socialis TaxID=392032 RepID=A0A820SMU6_9BILA|nr:unnamed protein product [Rotaria socialis]CAF3321900.1 unnamed protein product [Rotaria socialis]CAF3403922.1 unnamed protein product [Rotaria socialis]CAF3475492.1 unnamed protein product [Rotaria socialis]CAF3545201.1 unnamed protein product [Rotaria socialis]